MRPNETAANSAANKVLDCADARGLGAVLSGEPSRAPVTGKYLIKGTDFSHSMTEHKQKTVVNPLPHTQPFCNCRIEHYPSFMKLTVANRPVFRDPAVEYIPNRKPKRGQTEKRDEDNSEQRSVNRARKRIFDIAALNSFEYFVTLTLDNERIDRENADEVSEKLKTFLAHKVSRSGWSYLFVPEYHRDGKGIHLHGLVSGAVKLNDSGHKTKDGRTVYNLPEWTYGFSTCIELKGEPQHTARYITKYISKDFKKLFGNFYYSGGNVIRQPRAEYTDADFEGIDETPYVVPVLNMAFKYVELEGAM